MLQFEKENLPFQNSLTSDTSRFMSKQNLKANMAVIKGMAEKFHFLYINHFDIQNPL